MSSSKSKTYLDGPKAATTNGPLRRLVLHDGTSPGDVAVLTAAVKALHENYPGQFETDVRGTGPALWEGNPLITKLQDGERIECGTDPDHRFPGRRAYATVNASSSRPNHVVEAYCETLAAALGLERFGPVNWLQPSIFLTAEEKRWTSQVQDMTGRPTRFWIVNSGVKYDYTAKHWEGYQQVVDETKDRIVWVQIGSPEHIHRPMDGVIDLLGQTDLRQLVRLVYHAEGVLCGVTALQHLAHWVEPGPFNPMGHRHAVIIAGGRESPHWFAYPGQQIFHTIGELDCCIHGGCWKSRVEPIRESPEHNDSICIHPRGPQGLCMERIDPSSVAKVILRLAT